MAVGRGSVLRGGGGRLCDTLCTSGLMDDVTFASVISVRSLSVCLLHVGCLSGE